MPDPENSPQTYERILAEAVEQIRRLCDLLATRGSSLPLATATSSPISAALPSQPSELKDVTNYTYHAPAAVGSRVTVRGVEDVGTGAKLRAAGQAYAHSLADYLGAENVNVSPANTLSSGAEYVVIDGRLPSEIDGPAVLRSALVRFPSGTVNVEFVARETDHDAEGQFKELLRSLRPSGAGDTVAGALRSVVAAAPGPTRNAGPVTFDLPMGFQGPAAVRFAGPNPQMQIEVALAGAPSTPAPTSGHAYVGNLASAIGDDGRPVLYEIAPIRPVSTTLSTTGGALLAPPTTSPAKAAQEIEVNGRRVRVSVVGGGSGATETLLQDVVNRVQSGLT